MKREKEVVGKIKKNVQKYKKTLEICVAKIPCIFQSQKSITKYENIKQTRLFKQNQNKAFWEKNTKILNIHNIFC